MQFSQLASWELGLANPAQSAELGAAAKGINCQSGSRPIFLLLSYFFGRMSESLLTSRDENEKEIGWSYLSTCCSNRRRAYVLIIVRNGCCSSIIIIVI